MRWWLSRVGPGVWYAGALLVVGFVVNSLDAGTRQSWVAWTSTNLDNLGDHPLACLVTSAFVAEDGSPYAWVVLAVTGLVSLGWRLGPWRAMAVVASAHGIGTAVSEGLVAWQIHQGVLSSEARRLVDVGPSYVVASALVGAVAAGPLPARVAGAGGFGVLAPSLFGGLAELDVAAVGHVCSIAIGVVLASVLLPRSVAASPAASGPASGPAAVRSTASGPAAVRSTASGPAAVRSTAVRPDRTWPPAG